MKMIYSMLLLPLIFCSSIGYSAQFIEIGNKSFCAGNSGLAYFYDFDWEVGGWGPNSLDIKGVVVKNLENGSEVFYSYVKPSPALPKYGAVYAKSSSSSAGKRYIFISHDQYSGEIGHTDAFDKNGNPVSPTIEWNVAYALSATYQPWVKCY